MSFSSTQVNDLSAVIGELRNFAAQQVVTNQHMLDELKKIADKMSGLGEMGATFTEYRNVLHERFGKIHTMIGEIDERLDKAELKIDLMDDVINQWKGQVKSLVIAMGILGTIASALISTYGSILLKALASHSS